MAIHLKMEGFEGVLLAYGKWASKPVGLSNKVLPRVPERALCEVITILPLHMMDVILQYVRVTKIRTVNNIELIICVNASEW